MNDTRRRIAYVCASWAAIERDVVETNDPQAIEHAAIARLASVHLLERFDELRHDEQNERGEAIS
jgi:hypothetical protein